MILLNTNIMIEILKGDQATIQMVEGFSTPLFISSISAMELYYETLNKAEVKKIARFISLFKTVHLSQEISIKAIKLIQTYAKSHTLDIPDSLIAATAIVHNYQLVTYNVKDFRYIEGLKLGN